MQSNQASILIVDDEKDNLEALQRLLRGSYAVTTTTSPFEALKQVQQTRFHVIISDQRMPEMTGVELLEKAKKLAPQTTRILLTGYTDIASVIDAINRGNIYRYVAKPWDPEDLKMTVRQADEAYNLRTELEDKNIRLEKAYEELKVLDQAKARFLSLISHELNTPLTVLNSFVELLNGEKQSLSAELSKAVSSISNASSRFSEIVSEVLQYVRVASKVEIQQTSCNLLKVFKVAQSKIAEKYKLKNVNLDLNGVESVSVDADSTQLEILCQKLLEDSLQRAPQKSTVKVSVKKEGGGAQIVIFREGEPVPDQAFSPLETGQAEMHHQKNLGLALATCKLIVDYHHGKMSQIKSGKEIQLTIEI